MRKTILMSVVVLAAATAALGQDMAEAMKVIDALQADAAAHRTYLESLYSMTLKVVGLAVVVIGALIGFVGWKTLKDVRESAKAVYDSELRKLLDTHARELAAEVDRARTETEKTLQEMRADLSSQRATSDALIEAGGNRRPGSDADTEPSGAPGAPPDTAAKKRILWVDDVPENNIGPAGVLGRLGAEIDVALDTETAMRKLAAGHYDLVISDMGRADEREAGLTLLSQMKLQGVAVPAVIYASRRAVERSGAEARRLGARETIGTGPSALIAWVKSFLFPRQS